MNSVSLVGNITRDPKVETTPQGTPVTSFSVAVSGNFNKDVTNYINVVTWRKLAEVCGKYLAKGKKVGVTGEITSRTYDGKDGKKVYVTEVVADKVEFLSPMGNNQSNDAPNEAPQGGGTFTPVDESDLPF